jgi:hypothetical protein
MRPLVLCSASIVLLSGCLRREGRNENCQWPHERARLLNLQYPADQRHLRDDAQFAEELAVRYGDSLRRLVTDAQQKRNECMEVLFAQIAARHRVNTDEIIHAASGRDTVLDFTLVSLPMAIFFALFSYHLCGAFRSIDSKAAVTLVIFIASFLASGCGVLIGEMWALAVETLRIGNGHLSFRTARITWSNERSYLFAIGLVIFWLIAVFQYWRRPIASPSRLHRSQLGLES